MSNNALDYLKSGKTILYPTDTVWGIGCDATNPIAVQKIYKLKQRAESKSLIILVDSIAMLQSIIKNIPLKIIDFIQNTSKPTSIIYTNPTGLAKNVIAQDNTVAIRVTTDPFCKELIHKLGAPIVSTSANISGEQTPENFNEINERILESVDYIVPLQYDQTQGKSSQIIRLQSDGTLLIIRA